MNLLIYKKECIIDYVYCIFVVFTVYSDVQINLIEMIKSKSDLWGNSLGWNDKNSRSDVENHLVGIKERVNQLWKFIWLE